jgi:hypothetical protein
MSFINSSHCVFLLALEAARKFRHKVACSSKVCDFVYSVASWPLLPEGRACSVYIFLYY